MTSKTWEINAAQAMSVAEATEGRLFRKRVLD